MHVDEVLGSQEVVVKNLGPQLSRLPGLAGDVSAGFWVQWFDLQPCGLWLRCMAIRCVPPVPVCPCWRKPTAPMPGSPSSMLSGPSQVPLILVVDVPSRSVV